MIPLLRGLVLTLGTGVGAQIIVEADNTVTREKPLDETIKPSHESAKENANLIFNALHSAGRQWGSSLYHNGFGFLPAVMPEGTLLYHGTRHNETPPGPEWLAFEIEHAENFARSGRMPPRGVRPRPPPDEDEDSEEQQPLLFEGSHGGGHPPPGGDDDDEGQIYRGYLHTYQANRDLKLLYVDGMSAGKTAMGTLDSQDLLLRENASHHDAGWDEWRRALDICDMMPGWGYDGFVRMEIGFEVVFCNFTSGLDLISMTRTFLSEDKINDGGLSMFSWVRAASERFNEIGGDRLKIDFSSMVSGLFFPINISSTDVDRPDLVRLGSATLDELKGIKAYLKDVATQPRRFTVKWQAVVDMVVTRFARRLASMVSEDLPQAHFIEQLEVAILNWVDAPPTPDDVSLDAYSVANETADAIERCRKHYLMPAMVNRQDWSVEDELIQTAIDTVMRNICQELFAVRTSLLEASADTTTYGSRVARDENNDALRKAIEAGRVRVRDLMDKLGWTIWKQRQPCPESEVLFIAMWPFGGSEDHWNPGCRSVERLRETRGSYWRMDWGRPRKPPKDGEAEFTEL